MNKYEKLEWLVFAIQEAINGNNGELENALEIIEDLREPYLKKIKKVLFRGLHMCNDYLY